jgi:hypothetical protein
VEAWLRCPGGSAVRENRKPSVSTPLPQIGSHNWLGRTIMKLAPQFCGGLLVLVLAAGAFGQGTFQNLGFESPVLPLVHVDRGFDFVMASNAIPGWNLFIGTNQQTTALFNNYFLGTATVGLLGPGLTNPFPRIIDGSYTVTLQAGAQPQVPINPPLVDAAITQTSLVPVSARSIQLKAYVLLGPNAQFAVSLGGQPVKMVALTNTPSYTLYGGDITPFAGLNEELRIAALATPIYPFSAFAFDSIEFSPQAMPEPGAFSLFGLGGLFHGWRLSRKARS